MMVHGSFMRSTTATRQQKRWKILIVWWVLSYKEQVYGVVTTSTTY